MSTKAPTKPTKKPAKAEAPVEAIKPVELPTLPKLIETIKLPVKSLVLDAGTQPRLSLDDGKIVEYKEVILEAQRNGETKNPFDSEQHAAEVIRTPEGRLILWSGFHRAFAHKAAGQELPCNIREGTEQQAVLLSFGTNATHGLNRSKKDTKFVVQRALSIPEVAALPDTQIAKLCNTSTWTVAQLRSVANTPTTRKVTRGGKTFEVDVKNIGKKDKKADPSSPSDPKSEPKKDEPKKKGEKPAPEEPKKSVFEELWKEIKKIATSIAGAHGAAEGKKFSDGIESGALALNVKQVREFAGLSEKTIGNIWPLVKAGTPPWKAYEFSKSEISDKIITELHNRCLTNGGSFEHKSGGFTITVTKK